MSVYRDKRSQFYQYEFQIKGYRFYGSTKCDDECEARKIEAQKRDIAGRQVAHWIAEQRAPLTLGRAADRWWNEHGQHLSDAKVKSALDRMVEIMGAASLLHAINDEAVSQMIEVRRQDRRRDRTIVQDGRRTVLYRPITPTTVNRTLDLLKRVMYRARDNWSAALGRMPAWRKHRLKEIKRHVRELSAGEEAAIDATEDLDYADVRRFAIITGLRLSNLFVTKPQVDFELAILRVVTKGGVPRIIPLTREAYEILWRRRDHHPVYFFTSVCKKKWRNPHKTDDFREVGKRYPITADGFSSHKDRTWQKAGVNARIHDLRHTTGMRTLRKTGNLKVVQTLLGHADIKTTATFYTDATVEDLRQAMEATHGSHDALPTPAKLLEGKGEK
ncbi:tyrosine-type recombinase/integrase [Bradyrhizobium diazoefficiens]|uniref:tyrosine-type recombinase/integrase n=1 Tax=Bradyrhizobium diazoefficiens TaxID=1355477 RepID=UPI0038338CE3